MMKTISMSIILNMLAVNGMYMHFVTNNQTSPSSFSSVYMTLKFIYVDSSNKECVLYSDHQEYLGTFDIEKVNEHNFHCSDVKLSFRENENNDLAVTIHALENVDELIYQKVEIAEIDPYYYKQYQDRVKVIQGYHFWEKDLPLNSKTLCPIKRIDSKGLLYFDIIDKKEVLITPTP